VAQASGDGFVHVVIDGRFVLDEADLHRRLAGALGYGPYYRHDLACLRERLAAGDPRPLQLTWISASSFRLALGRAVFDEFVAVLERIQAQDAGKDWAERFVFRVFD
jgi:RNAse (barnase) inhibitor barstar